ncbi:hypothetical protein H0H81_000764, partial [Sphagnurus paluster]
LAPILKEKGAISDAMQATIWKLVALNVPEGKICDVLHAVTKGYGVKVDGSVSVRTVGRIVKEGGVAADIQLVQEIEQEK